RAAARERGERGGVLVDRAPARAARFLAAREREPLPRRQELGNEARRLLQRGSRLVDVALEIGGVRGAEEQERRPLTGARAPERVARRVERRGRGVLRRGRAEQALGAPPELRRVARAIGLRRSLRQRAARRER